MQIVRAVPKTAVVDILSTIHLRHRRTDDEDVHPARLLQLLPRAFHPAIVRACCVPRPGSPLSFEIRTVAPSTVCAAKDASGNVADANTVCERCAAATPTFQLLAAAAPLAGGSLEAAWNPDGAAASSTAVTDDGSGGARKHAGTPAAPATAHACLHLPQQVHAQACSQPQDGVSEYDWQLPSGSLTRLCLKLPGIAPQERSRWQGPMPLEPPRWCAALSQLRTLRALTLGVRCFVEPPPEEAVSAELFTDALRSLPAFEDLRVWYDYGEHIFPINEASMCTVRLLQGIARLPQLRRLHLDRCIDFVYIETLEDGGVLDGAVSQMSALTRLTCLHLKSCVYGEGCAAAFIGAVRHMAALQELDVALVPYEAVYDSKSSVVEIFLQLMSASQLANLERVSFGAFRLTGESTHAQVPIDTLHGCIRDHNPAMLTRMTALHLGHVFFGQGRGDALAGLLGGMPLQSLDLAQNRLADGGLLRLAAVLPHLPRLTMLDISGNHASHEGVFPVLAALAQRPAAAEAGPMLREVGFGWSVVPPQHAAELAALLAKLGRLEVLRMPAVYAAMWPWGQQTMGLGSLRSIVSALLGLPELRVLDVRHAVRKAELRAASAVCSSLTHVTCLKLQDGAAQPRPLPIPNKSHVHSSSMM